MMFYVTQIAFIVKRGYINESHDHNKYYRYGKLGYWNFGDRDISEWDTSEGNLYRDTIGEIRPASILGYIRGWDIQMRDDCIIILVE